MAFALQSWRGILYALSFVYDTIVQLRLYFLSQKSFPRTHARMSRDQHRNLTVGGTGKTPM